MENNRKQSFWQSECFSSKPFINDGIQVFPPCEVLRPILPLFNSESTEFRLYFELHKNHCLIWSPPLLEGYVRLCFPSVGMVWKMLSRDMLLKCVWMPPYLAQCWFRVPLGDCARLTSTCSIHLAGADLCNSTLVHLWRAGRKLGKSHHWSYYFFKPHKSKEAVMFSLPLEHLGYFSQG